MIIITRASSTTPPPEPPPFNPMTEHWVADGPMINTIGGVFVGRMITDSIARLVVLAHNESLPCP